MKTLVLGGTRFIGLALVKGLLARGYDVTVLNRGLTAGELPREVLRLTADRDDAAAMRTAVVDRSFDVAFDLSAYTVEQVRKALDAIGDRAGHYVFTSSTAVYYGSPIYPIHEHHFQTRRCVVYSYEKAVRNLDYQPRFGTRAGLADSYAWYKRELSGKFTWDLSEDDAVLAEIRKLGKTG